MTEKKIFKKRVQDFLFPVIIFSFLLGIARDIFGFIDFPYATYIFLGITLFLLEIYLIILISNTLDISRKKRKIILVSLFIIPFVFFSFLIWNEKRMTPILSDPRINIVRTRISTDSSQWKNIYENNQIIGFKNDILSIEEKWFKFHRSNMDKDLKGNKMNEKLLLAYNYLKQKIIKNSSNLNINFNDCEQSYKLIIESDFETFRNAMVNTFWNLDFKDNKELFKYIKPLWPQSEELTLLKNQMPNTYYALFELYMDLFRDVKPIFDIIIENNTKNEIIIHSASLNMRNILFDEIEFGGMPGTTLDVSAEYNWNLNNLKDLKLQKWVKKYLDKLDYKTYDLPVIYDKSILSLNFELDPPLIIQGNSSNRFYIRFAEGYQLSISGLMMYSSEIQFKFYYREKKGIVCSNWYRFTPY